MIKVVMVRNHRRLRDGDFRSRMVLQVHDELEFEKPATERIEVAGLVEEIMTGALPLRVPPTVSLYSGADWLEAC